MQYSIVQAQSASRQGNAAWIALSHLRNTQLCWTRAEKQAGSSWSPQRCRIRRMTVGSRVEMQAGRTRLRKADAYNEKWKTGRHDLAPSVCIYFSFFFLLSTLSTSPHLSIPPSKARQHFRIMGGSSRTNASIQAYLTPITSPVKHGFTTPIGDGFTTEEVQQAMQPTASASWHPAEDYADCEISDLYAGPRAVSFMGRVANIFDCANTPKTPRSAKGCIKLCIKDGGSAITV